MKGEMLDLPHRLTSLGAKTASRLGVGRGVEIKLLPITTAPTVDLGGEEVSWTSTELWVPDWKY